MRWISSWRSRPDAEHVSEAFGCGAARVRGSVLQRLLFGPGHLDSAMVLGAAAARPLSLPVRFFIIVRADAGQPEHGVAIFHQLGLSSDTQRYSFTPSFYLFISNLPSLPLSKPSFTKSISTTLGKTHLQH